MKVNSTLYNGATRCVSGTFSEEHESEPGPPQGQPPSLVLRKAEFSFFLGLGLQLPLGLAASGPQPGLESRTKTQAHRLVAHQPTFSIRQGHLLFTRFPG